MSKPSAVLLGTSNRDHFSLCRTSGSSSACRGGGFSPAPSPAGSSSPSSPPCSSSYCPSRAASACCWMSRANSTSLRMLFGVPWEVYVIRSNSQREYYCSFWERECCRACCWVRRAALAWRSCSTSLLRELLRKISFSCSSMTARMREEWIISYSRPTLIRLSSSRYSDRMYTNSNSTEQCLSGVLRMGSTVECDALMVKALRLMGTTPPRLRASPVMRKISISKRGLLASMRNSALCVGWASPLARGSPRQQVKKRWSLRMRIWSQTASITRKFTFAIFSRTRNMQSHKYHTLPTTSIHLPHPHTTQYQPIYHHNSQQLMASQYTAYLTKFGRSLLSGSSRLLRFLSHRLLSQKRAILVLGAEDSPIFTRLHAQLFPAWDFVFLTENGKVEEQASVQSVEGVGEKQVQTAGQVSASQAFRKISLNSHSLSEVEAQLQGRQFDSIIVLPQGRSSPNLRIEDEAFACEYPLLHEQLFTRNIFAYRLASKFLAGSGVIIFSASEQDFKKEESEGEKRKASFIKDQHELQDIRRDSKVTSFSNPNGLKEESMSAQQKEENEEKTGEKQNEGPGKQLVEEQDVTSGLADAQTCYLGVVVGDRDHTDLNSWSLVALSQEVSQTEPDLVANYYRIWSEGQAMPMPGSFALFRKDQQSRKNFVQYL